MDFADEDALDQEEDDDEVLREDEAAEEDRAEEQAPVGVDHAAIPNKLTTLRACIPCLLVKSHGQFLETGCENCEAAFSLIDEPEKIVDVTTENFEGLVALTSPEQSWVAAWQFLTDFKPGVYALLVKGRVSEATAKELEEAGLPNIGQQLQEKRG